jgi:hypothetical protein
LKKKYDALSAFKTFKNELEKEIGKIKSKSNNGGEYINNEFSKYF